MPRKYEPFTEVKKMIVTEEVASRLDIPLDTLEQLYDNTSGFSGMDLDPKQDDKVYLEQAVQSAMEHFTHKAAHRGWQAAVVFLALVSRNFETRRVFKNPMTLDDIRYGLDQNTRAELERAFRNASGISS